MRFVVFKNAAHAPRPLVRSSIILSKLLPLVCLGALAGCSSTTGSHRSAGLGGFGQIDPRYGVRPSPRVIADGEEVPKGGGAYMVGKPYKIAGRTYYPSERPYSSVGTASWYGSDFHGRRTANGEIFDRASISAAHPTMPLPSYARVTNLRNDRSMVVRVNDRGPYHGGRVMDVSQRVAHALDFHGVGTARVKVEWIGRADLAGDDDEKLLATLRDDGQPAQIDAPVMTAANEDPAPAARYDERAEVAELAARVSNENGQASDDQMRAYARQESDAPLPPSRLQASIDEEPVASTQKVRKAAAPLPPVRPAHLGGARQASAHNAVRQALNSSVRTN
ncbi:septal ring lytic transglycosylase RlpA family protein [Methylocystis rosea]|uniref:septal ring lytic transglycosylase RlpA family protein n=1 Tax=Methylocystis rosea TaxID=173366 RepID=UPI000376EBED|nr:septal ring lytic transglycosylase RlpA family protein [Methylocystis rosea]